MSDPITEFEAAVSVLKELGGCIIRGLSTGIGAAVLVASVLLWARNFPFLAASCGMAGAALIAFGMWEPEEPQ